jgi:hypothetical protein
VIPYKCNARHETVCGKEATISLYLGRWSFLCAEHEDEIQKYSPKVQATMIRLENESMEELNYRALPRGEDR